MGTAEKKVFGRIASGSIAALESAYVSRNSSLQVIGPAHAATAIVCPDVHGRRAGVSRNRGGPAQQPPRPLVSCRAWPPRTAARQLHARVGHRAIAELHSPATGPARAAAE